MGTLGKGRSTGSNAQYDISNLHFYRDGEDIGIAEFFGVDSSSIDKASTMVVATLTTPKKAAKRQSHWHMGILCQGGRSDDNGGTGETAVCRIKLRVQYPTYETSAMTSYLVAY